MARGRNNMQVCIILHDSIGRYGGIITPSQSSEVLLLIFWSVGVVRADSTVVLGLMMIGEVVIIIMTSRVPVEK